MEIDIYRIADYETVRRSLNMDNYKKEALDYLSKLEKLCKWLEFEKNYASYADFVKAGIITRGELRDKKYLGLRRDIVFWGNYGWTRAKEWKAVLKIKRQEINELKDDVE